MCDFSFQAWKDVSDSAKQFIDKLLVVDPEKRMTAEQAVKDPWIASSAASSSCKNLHRSVSQNWLKSSSRLNSARSNASQNSNKSVKSGRSVLSLTRRANCATISQDPSLISALTSTQGQENKQGGNKSSGTRDSNVKLTKQLVEKLHSVINEDDRELLSSTSVECEPPILRLTAECDSNRQQVVSENTTVSSSHTISSNRKTQNPYEIKTHDTKAVQRASSQDVIEEKLRGRPVPVVDDRVQMPRLVMRDNFLEEHLKQEAQQDFSQSSGLRTSFTEESPPRHQSLSPSPRKNKIYCTYDSS